MANKQENWLLKKMDARDQMLKRKTQSAQVEWKKSMGEYAIHKQISDFLAFALTPESYYTTVENSNLQGGTAGMIKQARNRERGVKAGFPDIIIIHRGQICCLEVKRPGKGATDTQSVEHKKLKEAGAQVEVVYDVDEVRKLLKIWQIPSKEHEYA